MADKLTHQKFDQLITELIEMTGATMAVIKARNLSPCCDGPSVEIFSTYRPIGYTGIYKCLVCDCTFDPTFRETTQ